MKKTVSLIACAALAACVQPTPTTNVAPSSQSSVSGLTCIELTERNQRITTRLREIEQESQATARSDALKSAALNIGIGALLGRSVGGGVDAIRTASTIGSGMQGVLAAETGRAQMGTVSDTLALARRSSELQRASIEQGC